MQHLLRISGKYKASYIVRSCTPIFTNLRILRKIQTYVKNNNFLALFSFEKARECSQTDLFLKIRK